MLTKLLVFGLVAAATLAGGGALVSGQSPSPTGLAASATPTVGPATPTPPVPSYDGRPCESGTLINDFVVLGDREEVPSCVQPFTADGSAVLYGLSPVPPGLRLRGVSEQTTQAGVRIVSVVYETAGGTPPPGPAEGRALVTISLQTDALSKPFPIRVLLKGTTSPGDFLPTPGLFIEPSAASQIGLWFGPSGLYRMDVDQSTPGIPLDIHQLVSSLAPLDGIAPPPAATPGPPATGTGVQERPSWTGWASRAAVALLTGIAAVAALSSHRRRKPASPNRDMHH